jgi:hypothetical protein
LALTVASTSLQAQDVALDIEQSVKVEFNSQKGYAYNVYGTSDPPKTYLLKPLPPTRQVENYGRLSVRKHLCKHLLKQQNDT